MTSPVTLVNTAADSWQVVINRINQLANLASNAMVTVSTSPSGSVSTGNGHVNGSLSATILATPSIRGGNVATAAVLNVTSNVTVGTITLRTDGTANAVSLGVGANVIIDTARLSVGNSTVNTVVSSTAVSVGGVPAATTNTRASVANGGLLVGTRGRINFVGGNNVTIAAADDAANNQVTVTITANSGSAASTPGGSNTFVQFNDSGTFGGAAGLGWNKTSNNLTISNTAFANVLSVGSGAVMTGYATLTTSGTTAQLVDSWNGSSFRTAFYSVSIKNESANGYSVAQLTLLFDGTDTHLLEVGTVASNGSLGVWSANASTNTVRLYYAPTPAAATIRAKRDLIVV